MTDAETAYLFRHAVLRDAAYELQPPRMRGQLHALAGALLHELLASWPEAQAAPFSAEVADHLLRARQEVPADAAHANLEAAYRKRAAQFARARYRLTEAAQQHLACCDIPGATTLEQVEAMIGAAAATLELGAAKSGAEIAQRAARACPENRPDLKARALRLSGAALRAQYR